MAKKNNTNVPPELEGAASMRDVSALEGRIEKCYSEERYAKFQTDVRQIVLETLGNDDGRTKVKAHACEAINDQKRTTGWEYIKFLTPIVMSAIAIGVAFYR